MVNDLRSEMQANGYNPKEIILDNKFHRFGDPDNQWLVGIEVESVKFKNVKFIIASYGDWRTGEHHVFSPKGKFSREDSAHIKASQEKLAAEIDKQKKEERDRASLRAQDLCRAWSRAKWMTGYARRKGISCLYGAFPGFDHDGEFLGVPLRDMAGRVWNVQKIRNDGEKRFLKGGAKRGLFHALRGDPATANVVMLAEGWATCGTLADAIEGAAIVCAFDAGNLKPVAQEIRRANTGAQIIICADNDKNGRGNEAANDAAQAAQAIIKLCPVVGQDFNDIGVEATQEFFEEQAPKDEEGKGVTIIPLGFSGSSFFFTSTYKPDLHEIARFTEVEMLGLAPIEYWQTIYPSKTGIDWHGAKSNLIGQCVKRGVFETKNVRGSGVWSDEGRVIVNFGNHLSVDGELCPVNKVKSRYLYVCGKLIAPPHPSPLTVKDCQLLVDICHSFKWEKEEAAPRILIGAIVLSRISGALPYRPNVWITGAKDSGKTTLFERLVYPMLDGGGNLHFLGGTTEAGVRQAVRSDAVPVIFDEFETNGQRSADVIQSIIELMRSAWSETHGFVAKGSSGGVASFYQPRFSSIVTSIRPNLANDADESRFTKLELCSHDSNIQHWARLDAMLSQITPTYGNRLFARAIKNIDLLLANFEAFRSVIAGRVSARFGNQYGMLLAGYSIAVSDAPLTKDEAEFLVDGLELVEERERAKTPEHHDALNHILTQKILVGKGGQPMSVSEAVDSARTNVQMNEAIQIYGMRVQDDGLFIHCGNTEFKKLLTGSRWINSAGDVLRRAPGASHHSCRIAKKAQWCLVLPLKLLE